MIEPPPAVRKAEALAARWGLAYEQILGLRFAVNVFIGTTIVWIVLRTIGDSNPLWAIASLVAASDPDPAEARRMFRSRLINVGVGCAVGLLFLYLFGGSSPWLLPFAMAVTVIVSTNFVKVKTMWRQAPITAAIVVAAGITTYRSTEVGAERGLHKVAEVIFGCLVGVLVSLFLSRFWLVRSPAERGAAAEPGAAPLPSTPAVTEVD